MTEHQVITRGAEQEPYRITQRDYLLLARNGAFDGLAKTELIEGVIYAVNAQFSRHVRVQSRLYRLLADACDRLGGELEAWIEGSIAVREGMMPQPDIFISRGLPDEGAIPVDQVALVIEVADTSLNIDLDEKGGVYAAAGVAEYWVADANGRVIHRFSEPSGGSYRRRSSVAFGKLVASITIADLAVETTGL